MLKYIGPETKELISRQTHLPNALETLELVDNAVRAHVGERECKVQFIYNSKNDSFFYKTYDRKLNVKDLPWEDFGIEIKTPKDHIYDLSEHSLQLQDNDFGIAGKLLSGSLLTKQKRFSIESDQEGLDEEAVDDFLEEYIDDEAKISELFEPALNQEEEFSEIINQIEKNKGLIAAGSFMTLINELGTANNEYGACGKIAVNKDSVTDVFIIMDTTGNLRESDFFKEDQAISYLEEDIEALYAYKNMDIEREDTSPECWGLKITPEHPTGNDLPNTFIATVEWQDLTES